MTSPAWRDNSREIGARPNPHGDRGAHFRDHAIAVRESRVPLHTDPIHIRGKITGTPPDAATNASSVESPCRAPQARPGSCSFRLARALVETIAEALLKHRIGIQSLREGHQ